LVHAALAPRRPLEVLYRVGHVHFVAVEPRLAERCIEQRAGGSDERSALDVFSITWLLADHDDRRAALSFSEDRLGCTGIKAASPARARGLAQRRQREAVGKKE
jgi:hypothetical protein